MKMYTNADQTAKLIELGFEKPKTKLPFEVANDELGYTYSIGELIEMIPPIFTNKYNYDCYLNIAHDSAGWVVDYTVYGVERPYIIVSEIELIDALFAMISKLYETGFYDFETKRYIY